MTNNLDNLASQNSGSVLVLWMLNSTFNNISVTSWRSALIYWWRKPEYPEKPLTCRKLLPNFIIECYISSTPRLSGIQTQYVSGDRY